MIIAIDPGKSGGIAWQYDGEFFDCCPMPQTDGDVVGVLQSFSARAVSKVCYIEKVGGFCGKNQPGSAMFNFGHGRGVIIGALMAFGWRIIEVVPQRWQKWLNIGKCGGDKQKLKGECQRRFPSQKVTLKTADALLILDYALAMENKSK
jgi:hypothetical protein